MDTDALSLTCAQARELDRLALEEFGLTGLVLMENAGGGAARLALAHWIRAAGARVEIACGPGNNGGDGWVVARHLANAGCDVHVAAFVPLAALRGDSAVNAHAAVRMEIAHAVVVDDVGVGAAAARWARADLVVDALLGTGAHGAPRGLVGRGIAELSRIPAGASPFVLALDVPSGLDADTGERAGPCVRADATATFGAAKVGFSAAGAVAWTGDVHVVDLGVPRSLFERVRWP